ncbi:MAG: ATP synthase F1 subunit delta [Proteobacteria bacterium]|nr:ATP synthase F1 subunit delta [Pseudomonadota bacterium]
MIGGGIAKRYAKAFFDIAEEEGKYEEYYGELRSFSSILEESESLRDFLSNAVFDQADKKAVVEKVLKKIDISDMTSNFLNLLVDKQRISILPDIENCYRGLIDRTLKKVRVDVRTAFPLSAELSESIRSSLEALTGKQVDITIKDDSTLLGGIVVGIGDTIYDGSIKTQLNNIGNLLGEGV